MRNTIFAAAVLCAAFGGQPAAAQELPPNPVLEALSTYVGRWRAEDRQAADGRTFHFVYELSWYDPGHTIIAMTITQAFDDGEARPLWEGFKGLHPDGDVYYYAFSPGGRAARGSVELDGDRLVTVYEGWSPGGRAVEIRDIFEPVEHDSFAGRTLMRASPTEEWREVNADSWERLEPRGSDSRPGGRS